MAQVQAAGELVLPAPAKLNLFLHITGRRADGMHELQTVFQLLDYADEVVLRARADAGINVRCRLQGGEDIPPQQNTARRAALLLRRHAGINAGADIEIRKRIAVGSGLGGGSSDAATVLCGLNYLWGTGCTTAQLAQLAATLGADVPVFVHGRSAWAEGIGERLTPVELPPRYFAVFIPPVAVASSEMFAAAELRRDCARLTLDDYRAGGGVNVFQPLAAARYPAVAAGIAWLEGFAEARLSGSGGAFFAAFEDAAQAQAVVAARPQGLDGFVAAGLAQSPLLPAVSAQAGMRAGDGEA